MVSAINCNMAQTVTTMDVDSPDVSLLGEDIVEPNTYVIVHSGADKRVFFHVKPGAMVKGDRKTRVQCDPAIAKPFGALFRVTGTGNSQTLTPVPPYMSVHDSLGITNITDNAFIPEADNSNIIDDNRYLERFLRFRVHSRALLIFLGGSRAVGAPEFF